MKTIISSSDAPAAVGPYSQAVRVGDLLFLSGQVGLDPGTGRIDGTTVAAQTHRIMANLAAVLAAAGATLGNLVRTTIYLTDMSDFAEVNAAYGGYFEDSPPARATVAVAALPLGALVEIDGIAALSS